MLPEQPERKRESYGTKLFDAGTGTMGIIPGCKWGAESSLFLLLAERAAVPLCELQPGRGRAPVRGLAGRPGPLLPKLKIRFDKTAVQKDDARQSFCASETDRLEKSVDSNLKRRYNKLSWETRLCQQQSVKKRKRGRADGRTIRALC